MRGFEREALNAVWPLALMTSTALTALPVLAEPATAGSSTQLNEIIVTAQKRSENIQKAPLSVQAIDTRKLTQLTVNNFQDYVKFIPSVSFQVHNGLNGGGGANLIYMRGIADGSTSPGGPLPTVGTYLDEQPITDIGGALDVHIYDIARLEILPGPQGTLYGASSESGTLRIITNQPSTSQFSGAIDLQGDTVSHGGQGYVAEGFVNIPINDRVAVRLVGFDERDAGFIDNVPATRTFATSGQTIDNTPFARKDFNGSQTFGGRAAVKFDVNDSWTVTPSVMAQDQRSAGIGAYEPAVGYLQVERFGPDTVHDRWVQAALTINGKIQNFDLTYAGAYFNRRTDSQTDYTDYSVFYDSLYGSGANWLDNSGAVIGDPRQEVQEHARYSKESNEIRIATPAANRLRFIGGLYQQIQTTRIIEPYTLNDYADATSVPGYPHAIFLINQRRVDSDVAAFGEATFDITDKLSILAGIRGYEYHNTLEGYYGFATPPFGEPGSKCVTSTMFQGAPCATFDKKAVGAGETHKINLTYRFDGDHLVYFTYSTGFRPGGINRNPAFGSYGADHLDNFEVGWKTGWLDNRMHWNGALYRENWDNFQFSFEGPNGTSIYQSGPSANVTGFETSLDWAVGSHLSLSGGAAYSDARISQDFCGVDASLRPIQDCAGRTIQIAGGTPLPYTPRFKGNLTGRYGFDLLGWNAHVQASLLYRGGIPVYLVASDIAAATSGFSDYRLGSFVTMDLSVGAEKDGYRFEVFAKNLLDTHGALNAATSCAITVCGSTAVPGVPQAVYVTPLAPLTVGIKIGKSF
jgi:outer membrane receptor protein involved in Fe transport